MLHLERHYEKKGAIFPGLIITLADHFEGILMRSLKSPNYPVVITRLSATGLAQELFHPHREGAVIVRCGVEQRRRRSRHWNAESWRAANSWLRRFHAKDLHGLCDDGAGVGLAVDAHDEGLVQQDVGVF